MKQVIRLTMMFLFTMLMVSCSVESIPQAIQGLDGKDGIDGIDGVDGLNAIQSWETLEGASSYCFNGGLAINLGLDTNRNGILDSNEITATNYLCNGTDGIDGVNGIDGTSAYATTKKIEPSEEYPWGGYEITIVSASGTEVIFVSNGADGIDGINGIDGIDGKDGTNATIYTEYVKPGTEGYPWGGYFLYVISGDDVEKIFLSNGSDGINGIDGIDGKDGVNAHAWVEEGENGYWLYIGTDTQITKVFVTNGSDGTNGVDGIDGIDGTNGQDGTNGTDGEDGVSVVVKTEKTDDGYWLYVTDVNGTTKIFIENGEDGYNGLDGTNGLDGKDGQDGQDGTNGEDGTDGTNGTNGLNGINGIDGTDGISVTIRTEKVKDGYILYITDSTGEHSIFIKNGVDGKNGLDGEDGEDGDDGDDGQDGYSSSVTIEIYEGEYCEFGGYVITITNTDPEIEDQVAYLCMCECESDDDDDCDDDDDKKKITICHKEQIGNDWKFVTLTLPAAAVQAHLDHGDSIGACEE